MYSLPYHRLRTNTRPTDKEETKARRTIGKALSKFTTLESEINRLQDRLVTLHQKKKENELYIEVHLGLLSPIRRLLPEILQEVFWRCLATARNSVLSFQEVPLLLGRVCRQWRQIAYSTPRLWTSLHIITIPLAVPLAQARFDACDAWLARSGALPLAISMSTVEERDIFTREFRPYFDLIAKHARRWKSIHLQVYLRDPVDILTEIHADDLPLLEAFHIHQIPPKAQDDATIRLFSEKDGIPFAPSLRDLSICHCNLRLLDLPVHWDQLTSLDFFLRPFELTEVFELLASCSNLESCSMNCGILVNPSSFSAHPQSSDNKPKVILSKLRTLRIFGGLGLNHHGSPILLNNLSTPALRHFSYQHLVLPRLPLRNIPFTELSPSLEIFRSFFQRLDQPLEELDFAIDGIMTRYLMEFLSLVPGLKRLSFRHLTISDKSFNDRLLLGLIPYERRRHCPTCSLEGEQVEELDSIIPSLSCLCPKLEVLDVDDALLSKHVLLEYLQSRLVDYDKYNVARLRRFAISFDFSLEDCEMTREIFKLAEESGMVDMRLCRRRLLNTESN